MNNILLTELKGLTGEYGPEIVAVETEHSEVCTKMTEGQFSPVRLEQATCRLVSSFLFGTDVLATVFEAFENQKKRLLIITISMEMALIEKSLPRKNQSQCSDLPQDCLERF